MFGSEAVRMLRESWSNATMLAQELYAIFTDNQPLSNAAPLSLSNPTGSAAPLNIQLPGLGNVTINFTGQNGEPAGSLVVDNGVPMLMTATGAPAVMPVTAVGGNVASGTVMSGGPGSGPYAVKLRVSGVTVNVIQLQIDPAATIPSGTSCLVIKEGAGYFMQVPVWL